MSGMGTHSKPLDGTVTANGRQLAPFPALQVQRLAPVPDGTEQPRTMAKERERREHRAWLDAIPVVLVNVVAFGAQLGFWRAHLAVLPQAVMVALALESIAVYLAWHAHLAQKADDSALRLRLAAYGMALVIGALNYSHYMAPGWRPTVAAVTFGLMSAISPWLWSVHSRRESRDILKASGDIEPHAVRLGVTRWAWHPVRSCRVMFRATWLGVTKPADAIGLPAIDAPAVTPQAVAHGGGKGDRAPRQQVTRGPTLKELAAREGVSVRTLQRRRNAKTGSAT